MQPLRSLAIACVLLAAQAGALAQDGALAAADRAYDEGSLRDAARAYDDALRAGGLDAPQLVRAHLRLGVLSVLGGERERGDRHFAIALALDPTREAPDELSPEVRARFDAARDLRGGRRIALDLGRQDGALVVSVRDAPDALAAAIQLTGAGWSERLAWQGQPIRVEPPPEALPIEAVLLDAHGNALARAGARTTSAALVDAVEEPAAQQASGGRNLLESPWLWIAVGAIVIGIAVAIVVSASGDRYLLDPPVVR